MSESKRFNKNIFTSEMSILIYLAAITTLAHIFSSKNYGYFLDELYTIACSKHLSFGFIDIPPVAPAILALNRAILGDSLVAIRLIPSIFTGLIVILTGLMAKELGGKKFSIILAGLSAMFVPVWLAVGTSFTYDVFDQLNIVLLFYVAIKYVKTGNSKLWCVIGLITGIGLMIKPSMLFFISVFVLAAIATKHRKDFLTPWPWIGGLIALIIIMPSLVWQIQNHFPIAEYWASYSKNKTVDVNALFYFIMQIIVMNIILLPIWITGLYYFLFNKQGKEYRILGLTYILLLLLFMKTQANVHMLTPAYAMLLAGGCVKIESFLTAKKWRILKVSYLVLVIIIGLVQAPQFMTILKVDNLISYLDTIGRVTGAKSIKMASESTVELPSFFYNRMEWDVLVNDVAEVYNSLPKAERKDTGILSQNYGYAGAVDLLGEKYGLPKALCGQLNYYLFSLNNNLDKKTYIVINESKESLLKAYDSVRLGKITKSKYRMPYEMPIYICRGPKISEDDARQALKNFR